MNFHAEQVGRANSQASSGSRPAWQAGGEAFSGTENQDEEGSVDKDLAEAELRKRVQEKSKNFTQEELQRWEGILDRKEQMKEKFKALKKPKGTGLGTGKVACMFCRAIIDGACNTCPECSADLAGPKRDARKGVLEEMLREGEEGRKYYDPAKALRSMRDMMEEMNACSGNRVHVAIFWAYKTKTGKKTVSAFGVGKVADMFLKGEAILPHWELTAKDVLHVELARHREERPFKSSLPGIDEECDLSHVDLEAVLKELKLQRYFTDFRENNVTMDTVKDLTLKQMADVLAMKTGDAMAFWRKVQVLQKLKLAQSRTT